MEQNPALRATWCAPSWSPARCRWIVLVVVLGSLVAGAVPLLLALFVIPIVLSIVFALSHITDVTVFAPNVVTLVGLGIAIDYSLLVVYRFREGLTPAVRSPTRSPATMQTAVRAVVFSGVTVGIGLGVLLLVRVPFVQSFGLAGILIPIVTIAAALTLLPALMAMLGHRIDSLGGARAGARRVAESRPWRRIAEQIMRAPLVFLVVGGAVIVGRRGAGAQHRARLDAARGRIRHGAGIGGRQAAGRRVRVRRRRAVRILVDGPAAERGAVVPQIRAAAGVREAVVVPGPTGRCERASATTRSGRPRRTSSCGTCASPYCPGCSRRRRSSSAVGRRCSTTSSRRCTATSGGSR